MLNKINMIFKKQLMNIKINILINYKIKLLLTKID